MMNLADVLHKTITLGRAAEFVACVSPEDYDYLIQFKWNVKESHPKGKKKTFYARRSQRNPNGERHPGGEIRNETIYMHVEIMQRQGLQPPTDDHTVDHEDCDGLNNTRENLSWACPVAQRKNRKTYVK